jgi:TRAP-type transport system periplasmic protein
MNIRRNAPTNALAAILLAASALAVLASPAPATKANGPAVLRFAARDSDFASDPALGDFVERVGRLSGGALRIEVVGGWGNGRRGAEQQIVRDVAAGKADLGSVGTRVIDTLGVASFQALTAPMLIDNYRLEQAVIASAIPGQMLSSLVRARVIGLAVLAGGLRKPVAVHRSLLGPTDWHGIAFAAFRSRGAAASIRALGAQPSDLWGDALSSV